MIGDSTVLHYGSFLISEGKRPYLDFFEPDLPGAYIQESVALRVFGTGDRGWHLYDLFILSLGCLACTAISMRVNWAAGLMAGASFAMLHLSIGPGDAGQREEVMTIYLLIAIAALFRAVGSQVPWLMIIAGFFTGFAASIKPTVCVLGVLLLCMLLLALRKQQLPMFRYLAFALLGFASALSLTLIFLWHTHAFRPFLENVAVVIPFYAKLDTSPLSELLAVIPKTVAFELALGLLLLFVQRELTWRDSWERIVVLITLGFGLFSYLVQRKAFSHHLHVFFAFTFLFFFIEVSRGLRARKTARVAAIAAVIFGLCVSAVYSQRVQRIRPSDEAATAMVADILRLGGQNLQGRVQCLDFITACSSALYRTGLVEDPAFLVDFTILPSASASALPSFQQRFWDGLQRNPPQVIFITNDQLSRDPGFDKVDHWPAFAHLLQSCYSLETTRNFGLQAYRIYLRKDASGACSLPFRA